MSPSPSTEGMTLADAIRIVDSHQTWRTWKHDEGGPEMVHPRELTAALNILLSVCRGELRRQREARKPAATKSFDDAADWRPSQGITKAPQSLAEADEWLKGKPSQGIGAAMEGLRSQSPRIKPR
jgi:hypothetical protein